MKKTPKKQLALSTTTVRALTRALDEVQGGLGYTGLCNNYTSACAQSNHCKN